MMIQPGQVKDLLIVVILIAVLAKILWWVVAPMFPYVVVIFLLIGLYGFIFRRKW